MHAQQLFLIAVVCLGMAELTIWKGIYPESFGRTFDEVQRDDVLVSPAEIDLGDVAIGETRKIGVQVTNRKKRSIQLRQPESSCGCIRFTLDHPLEVGPGETVELAISYTAPKVPKDISKNVLLRVATAKSAWRIPLKGRVVAESWASPPKHIMTKDEKQFGTIHFAAHREVADLIISDPDQIKVTLGSPSANGQTYRVQLTSQTEEEGEGYVAFLDAAENCLATVPIVWRPPGVIACNPNLVVLDPDAKNSTEEWNVVVLRNADKTDEPAVDVLVPWVKIRSQTYVSEDVLKLSVEVNRKRTPENFDGPIVRITDKRSGQCAELKGRI